MRIVPQKDQERVRRPSGQWEISVKLKLTIHLEGIDGGCNLNRFTIWNLDGQRAVTLILTGVLLTGGGCNRVPENREGKAATTSVATMERQKPPAPFLESQMGLRSYRYRIHIPSGCELSVWSERWENGKFLRKIGGGTRQVALPGEKPMERYIEFGMIDGTAWDKPKRARLSWISMTDPFAPPGAAFSRFDGWTWHDKSEVTGGISGFGALDQVTVSPGETKIFISYTGAGEDGRSYLPIYDERGLAITKAAFVCKVRLKRIPQERLDHIKNPT